jgi:hypothetical protein
MSKITIKCFGFDSPPVGIISVLESLNFPSDVNFVLFDPLNGVEFPYAEIDNHPKQNLYVVITTHEGASHLWFDRLLHQLVTQHQIPSTNIVLRSGCLRNPNSPIHHIHTIVDECNDFVSKIKELDLTVTPDTTHHFVCLNHYHRWQRYQLVQQLLDWGLDKFGKISYIKPPAKNNDHRFPLFLNHHTRPITIDWHQQRNICDPDIAGALVNLITESSYEPEPGLIKPDTHYLPVLSEKTYKCFAMHQLPVWLAPYRSVECYRNLGFDVFDDWVDHSYDLESDSIKRIELVAKQIKKLCELTDLSKIRCSLQSRHVKNLNTLKSYTAHGRELPQWKKIFNVDCKD